MESEKSQRAQKKEQIGDNLDVEMMPMEHTKKEGTKQVTVIKQTPVAYVVDLKQKITDFVHQNSE